eukprot:3999491-Amphidinium_carterae.1
MSSNPRGVFRPSGMNPEALQAVTFSRTVKSHRVHLNRHLAGIPRAICQHLRNQRVTREKNKSGVGGDDSDFMRRARRDQFHCETHGHIQWQRQKEPRMVELNVRQVSRK